MRHPLVAAPARCSVNLHTCRKRSHVAETAMYYSSLNKGITNVTQLAGSFGTLPSVTTVHSNSLHLTSLRDLPNGVHYSSPYQLMMVPYTLLFQPDLSKGSNHRKNEPEILLYPSTKKGIMIMDHLVDSQISAHVGSSQLDKNFDNSIMCIEVNH